MQDERDQARNWAQARERIDSGQTGDKVAASDPAAAPLGTDGEAGGDGTPAEDIDRSVRRQEAGAAEDAAHRRRAARQRRVLGTAALVGLAVAVAVIAIAFATTS